jgi:hypothetical protein
LDNFERLENVLNPVRLNFNLKIISVYIAVYESIKDTMVTNVKYFYCFGFKDGKEIFEGYEENVLSKVKSKKNKVIKATLKWFVDMEAITDEDCKTFEHITDMRNKLAHEMAETIFEGIDNEVIILFHKMIALYEKVEKWWIKEIEIPINVDITQAQYKTIDWENTSSVRLTMLKIMSDVAINDSGEYLKEYIKVKNETN